MLNDSKLAPFVQKLSEGDGAFSSNLTISWRDVYD
jgi:hypothetical protein